MLFWPGFTSIGPNSKCRRCAPSGGFDRFATWNFAVVGAGEVAASFLLADESLPEPLLPHAAATSASATTPKSRRRRIGPDLAMRDRFCARAVQIPGANRIARAAKKISARRIRDCLALRSPHFSSEHPSRVRGGDPPPGRSQENSLYELLIAEIARARSEERICG